MYRKLLELIYKAFLGGSKVASKTRLVPKKFETNIVRSNALNNNWEQNYLVFGPDGWIYDVGPDGKRRRVMKLPLKETLSIDNIVNRYKKEQDREDFVKIFGPPPEVTGYKNLDLDLAMMEAEILGMEAAGVPEEIIDRVLAEKINLDKGTESGRTPYASPRQRISKPIVSLQFLFPILNANEKHIMPLAVRDNLMVFPDEDINGIRFTELPNMDINRGGSDNLRLITDAMQRGTLALGTDDINIRWDPVFKELAQKDPQRMLAIENAIREMVTQTRDFINSKTYWDLEEKTLEDALAKGYSDFSLNKTTRDLVRKPFNIYLTPFKDSMNGGGRKVGATHRRPIKGMEALSTPAYDINGHFIRISPILGTVPNGMILGDMYVPEMLIDRADLRERLLHEIDHSINRGVAEKRRLINGVPEGDEQYRARIMGPNGTNAYYHDQLTGLLDKRVIDTWSPELQNYLIDPDEAESMMSGMGASIDVDPNEPFDYKRTLDRIGKKILDENTAPTLRDMITATDPENPKTMEFLDKLMKGIGFPSIVLGVASLLSPLMKIFNSNKNEEL